MTWKLIHDSETVGEWADEMIDKTVKELTDNAKSPQAKFKGSQKKSAAIVAEFLPDPIREALLNLHG